MLMVIIVLFFKKRCERLAPLREYYCMEKNEKGFLMSYPDEVVGVVSSHSGARE